MLILKNQIMKNKATLSVFFIMTLFTLVFVALTNKFVNHYVTNWNNMLINAGTNPVEEILNLRDVNQKLVPSKVFNLYGDLVKSEKFRKYSQNNEDGVIRELIKFLDLKSPDENGNLRYYVEFGTQNGEECNTRYLREYLNWTGSMFDGSYNIPEINLNKEFITHENVLDIFEKYNVPIDLDLLSEDTDYSDYWLVEKILTKYRPKIVVHERNQEPAHRCVTVQKPTGLVIWDRTHYFGGSVCAFYCLAKRFGYTMVYCETNGINCFWIRNDLLEKRLNFRAETVQKLLTPEFLFTVSVWKLYPGNGSWLDVETCYN